MCKAVSKNMPSEEPDEYAQLVHKSKFFCSKCGLCSNSKEVLCKAKKISDYIKKKN